LSSHSNAQSTTFQFYKFSSVPVVLQYFLELRKNNTAA
jgi:hypothetical protein